MPEALPEEATLDRYLLLLEKWSRVHNLTGCDDPDGRRALATDCEALVKAADSTAGDVCDVGSGAGMPGIPLALDQPHRKVALVESEGSKAAFLEQVRIELGMTNMSVVHSRVEDWRPADLPALICARGFSSLSMLVASCAALIRPGTRLLALKSRDPAEEIRGLRASDPRWEVTACTELPGTPSRFLVEAVTKT